MPQLVAIDIGSSKIKFAVGKADSKKLTANRLVYTNTPQNAVNNGEIIDINLLREALTVVVNNNKLRGKNAVVTIQSSTFISREFTIPKLKPQEAISALRFEVEQYVPVQTDEYVFSCRELEPSVDEQGNECMKYLVGLMPKRIVASYYDLLKAAGLNPIAMDVNANCIEKFIKLGGQVRGEYNSVLLVADIGNDAMDMTVLEGGLPTVNRTVPLGSSEITRGVSHALSIDYDEADVIKIRLADLTADVSGVQELDADAEAVASQTMSVASDWAEQLRRMAEFYMSRTKGKNVDFVYIYGGSSALRGIEGYLSNALGLTVNIMPLPENVRLRDTSPAPVHTFLNAMGALIRK